MLCLCIVSDPVLSFIVDLQSLIAAGAEVHWGDLESLLRALQGPSGPLFRCPFGATQYVVGGARPGSAT